ncbi:MAG: NusG domain II-containing protein [Lachnospiraceae bacterium]|nr:NusG domain II-containing protein [Lachnospiraceae bacterium]
MKKVNEKEKLISVADIALALGIILLCVAGVIALSLMKEQGGSVQISVEGKVIETLPLSKDIEYEITTDKGTNIVVVDNGKANVSFADCPDKVCVKHNYIDETGETIICLPHKLVIEIID